MDIQRVLHDLAFYYADNRGVGNTTLMKRGTSNFEHKKLVLLHELSYGDALHLPMKERVSLISLDKLKGSQLPLAIDNAALFEIFSTASRKISKLEADFQRINLKYEGEKLMREFADNDIEEMKKHPFKTFFNSLKELWRR